MFTLKRPRNRRDRAAITASGASPHRRDGELFGQTVVVLGDSAGIGLDIARGARAAGADVILADGDPERLERAARGLGARSTAAFDAADQVALKRFFDGRPGPIDHVVVTARGPHDGPPAKSQAGQARDGAGERRALALDVARNAAGKMRPGGTLLLTGGTGLSFTSGLAVALAPIGVRVQLIDAESVDSPVPASVLGDPFDAMRIGPVVEADDVAARAVRVMAKTPLTGANEDTADGRQVLARAA